MSLLQIAPEGVTELFVPPPVSRPEPGNRLASYPDGPGKGEDAPVAEAEDDRLIVLSDPIAAEDLDAFTPYVIRDGWGRVLCVNAAGTGGWDWAYFGQYDAYPKDVLPISFTGNPTTAPAALTVPRGGQTWSLRANGSATSWEWTFWAPPGYSTSYPVMSMTASPTQTNPDGTVYYNLLWSNGATSMKLCVDDGSWNWAYVSGTADGSRFTFHKFYVRRVKVETLLAATWPSATYYLKTGDGYFEAVTSAMASLTYQNSGLAGYQYRPEAFDCDDYSYVYKGQASKDAYAAKSTYGYAVGMVSADGTGGRHAVNVFVDTSGELRILEPQTGDIVAAKDWKDDQGAAYQPYFVLM